MKKRKYGFCWHLHHDRLMEWCYDYDERVTCIKEEKPQEERPIRLRLFKRVKGSLPKTLLAAGADYNRTGIWGLYEATLKRHAHAIKALHEKECPGCPWNGKTIFPTSPGDIKASITKRTRKQT